MDQKWWRFCKVYKQQQKINKQTNKKWVAKTYTYIITWNLVNIYQSKWDELGVGIFDNALSGVPSKCQTVYVALKNCCCMYCSCCKNTKQSKKIKLKQEIRNQIPKTKTKNKI